MSSKVCPKGPTVGPQFSPAPPRATGQQPSTLVVPAQVEAPFRGSGNTHEAIVRRREGADPDRPGPAPASTRAPPVSARQADDDGLGLGERLDTSPSALTPEPGLLHAAERRIRPHGVLIDPDRAGPDGPGDAKGTCDVGGVDARPEPVLRVVGQCDGVRLVVERHGHQHRPEDLFARHRHGIVDVGEQGRIDEVALGKVASGSVSASHQARAL